MSSIGGRFFSKSWLISLISGLLIVVSLILGCYSATLQGEQKIKWNWFLDYQGELYLFLYLIFITSLAVYILFKINALNTLSAHEAQKPKHLERMNNLLRIAWCVTIILTIASSAIFLTSLFVREIYKLHEGVRILLDKNTFLFFIFAALLITIAIERARQHLDTTTDEIMERFTKISEDVSTTNQAVTTVSEETEKTANNITEYLNRLENDALNQCYAVISSVTQLDRHIFELQDSALHSRMPDTLTVIRHLFFGWMRFINPMGNRNIQAKLTSHSTTEDIIQRSCLSVVKSSVYDDSIALLEGKILTDKKKYLMTTISLLTDFLQIVSNEKNSKVVMLSVTTEEPKTFFNYRHGDHSKDSPSVFFDDKNVATYNRMLALIINKYKDIFSHNRIILTNDDNRIGDGLVSMKTKDDILGKLSSMTATPYPIPLSLSQQMDTHLQPYLNTFIKYGMDKSYRDIILRQSVYFIYRKLTNETKNVVGKQWMDKYWRSNGQHECNKELFELYMDSINWKDVFYICKKHYLDQYQQFTKYLFNIASQLGDLRYKQLFDIDKIASTSNGKNESNLYEYINELQHFFADVRVLVNTNDFSSDQQTIFAMDSLVQSMSPDADIDPRDALEYFLYLYSTINWFEYLEEENKFTPMILGDAFALFSPNTNDFSVVDIDTNPQLKNRIGKFKLWNECNIFGIRTNDNIDWVMALGLYRDKTSEIPVMQICTKRRSPHEGEPKFKFDIYADELFNLSKGNLWKKHLQTTETV